MSSLMPLSTPKLAIYLCLILLSACTTNPAKDKTKATLIHAKHLFDGNQFHHDTSILVRDGKIEQVAARSAFTQLDANVIDLGNATLLPGFIELHAHLSYRKVPENIVLQHGITTIRDLGGPIHKPYGGSAQLRVLTAGPLLTAPNGYPISSMGRSSSVLEIQSEQHAKATVQELAKQGAVIIKVALEPGGETGAPWAPGHHHGHASTSHHRPKHAMTWPLLSTKVVKSIVDEAHRLGLKVTAHVGEAQGAKISLDAGVDEWAHIPCAAIPEPLLAQAVNQNVTMISTLDTLSKCSGIKHNTHSLAKLGAQFLYGAEIAHPDIPWGIDVQELMYLQQWAKMPLIEVLKSATSKAGAYLNIPLLGSLQANAPADIIAVPGHLKHSLKILEYPSFVMSGGIRVK